MNHPGILPVVSCATLQDDTIEAQVLRKENFLPYMHSFQIDETGLYLYVNTNSTSNITRLWYINIIQFVLKP